MPWRKLFGKSEPEVAVEVEVVAKLWKEDGVWNSSAVDLPIVVFGNTPEEATHFMGEAVIAHLSALQKAGKLDETVDMLRSRGRSVSYDEIDRCGMVTKVGAAVYDNRVLELV